MITNIDLDLFQQPTALFSKHLKTFNNKKLTEVYDKKKRVLSLSQVVPLLTNYETPLTSSALGQGGPQKETP